MKQQENFFTKTFSRQIYTRMLQAAETGSIKEGNSRLASALYSR